MDLLRGQGQDRAARSQPCACIGASLLLPLPRGRAHTWGCADPSWGALVTHGLTGEQFGPQRKIASPSQPPCFRDDLQQPKEICCLAATPCWKRQGKGSQNRGCKCRARALLSFLVNSLFFSKSKLKNVCLQCHYFYLAPCD